jgi:ferredoxin
MESFLGLYKIVSNFLQPPKSPDDNQDVQILKDKVQEMTQHLGSMKERIADFEEAVDTRTDFTNVHFIEAPTKIGNSMGMVATVNREECLCCGLCVGLCQEQAITMNDIATVDPDKCSGCGSCIDECPNQAISLIER